MPPSSTFLNPPGLATPAGFSHVGTCRADTLVFVSGQVAYDAEGRIVGEGDLEAQTRQVFHNLGTALQAAGAGFGDIVKLTFFVRDLDAESIAVIRRVRREFLSAEQPPASTMVGVAALAKPALRLEVEAYAARPA